MFDEGFLSKPTQFYPVGTQPLYSGVQVPGNREGKDVTDRGKRFLVTMINLLHDSIKVFGDKEEIAWNDFAWGEVGEDGNPSSGIKLAPGMRDAAFVKFVGQSEERPARPGWENLNRADFGLDWKSVFGEKKKIENRLPTDRYVKNLINKETNNGTFLSRAYAKAYSQAITDGESKEEAASTALKAATAAAQEEYEEARDKMLTLDYIWDKNNDLPLSGVDIYIPEDLSPVNSFWQRLGQMERGASFAADGREAFAFLLAFAQARRNWRYGMGRMGINLYSLGDRMYYLDKEGNVLSKTAAKVFTDNFKYWGFQESGGLNVLILNQYINLQGAINGRYNEIIENYLKKPNEEEQEQKTNIVNLASSYYAKYMEDGIISKQTQIKTDYDVEYAAFSEDYSIYNDTAVSVKIKEQMLAEMNTSLHNINTLFNSHKDDLSEAGMLKGIGLPNGEIKLKAVELAELFSSYVETYENNFEDIDEDILSILDNLAKAWPAFIEGLGAHAKSAIHNDLVGLEFLDGDKVDEFDEKTLGKAYNNLSLAQAAKTAFVNQSKPIFNYVSGCMAVNMVFNALNKTNKRKYDEKKEEKREDKIQEMKQASRIQAKSKSEKQSSLQKSAQKQQQQKAAANQINQKNANKQNAGKKKV